MELGGRGKETGEGNVQWDVYAPFGDRFDPDQVEEDLRKKITLQLQDEWMIKANRGRLSAEQADRMREIVRTNDWKDVVMFGSSRREPEEW